MKRIELGLKNISLFTAGGRQNAVWIMLLLFIVLLPLSQSLSVKVLVVALVLSLFVQWPSITLLFLWDSLLYLIVLAVGVFYSENTQAGLAKLETSFSLIAIPLVLLKVPQIDGKRLMVIAGVFGLGLFIACAIVLVNAVVSYGTSGDPSVFFYYSLTKVISSHPTYFAYYLIFAITAGLYFMYYGVIKSNHVVTAIVVFFFLVMLILTGGRTAFISIVLVFSFFILKYLLEPRNSRKSFVFGVVCLLMGGMFLFSFIEYNQGFGSLEGDYWERSVLWRSAIEANSNFMFGAGTGDSEEALKRYYLSHGMEDFAREGLNAHNQFIQSFLTNGLVGLLSVLLLLARSLYVAFRNQLSLGILVLFPFVVYALNEVFLGRYQGVAFYALLHYLITAASVHSRNPASGYAVENVFTGAKQN
jgi:O-antigen ligase